MAHPLFGLCGPYLSLARPLLSPAKSYILHYCSLTWPFRRLHFHRHQKWHSTLCHFLCTHYPCSWTVFHIIFFRSLGAWCSLTGRWQEMKWGECFCKKWTFPHKMKRNWIKLCFVIYDSNHTQPFNGLFPGLPRWAGTRKAKPIWILLEQETVSGSGISWATCKSAPCSRQITMPASHRSVFYRPDALPAAQPTVLKHWRHTILINYSQ